MKPQPWKKHNHWYQVGAACKTLTYNELAELILQSQNLCSTQSLRPFCIRRTGLHLLGLSVIWTTNSTMHRGLWSGSLHSTYWSTWSLPFPKILEIVWRIYSLFRLQVQGAVEQTWSVQDHQLLNKISSARLSTSPPKSPVTSWHSKKTLQLYFSYQCFLWVQCSLLDVYLIH